MERYRTDRSLFTELPKGPPSVSDYALVRRQFQIFERALKKFKGDVGLWIQYVQVAKREGARALVGRITARYVPSDAMELHDGQWPKCLHWTGWRNCLDCTTVSGCVLVRKRVVAAALTAIIAQSPHHMRGSGTEYAGGRRTVSDIRRGRSMGVIGRSTHQG